MTTGEKKRVKWGQGQIVEGLGYSAGRTYDLLLNIQHCIGAIRFPSHSCFHFCLVVSSDLGFFLIYKDEG